MYSHIYFFVEKIRGFFSFYLFFISEVNVLQILKMLLAQIYFRLSAHVVGSYQELWLLLQPRR